MKTGTVPVKAEICRRPAATDAIRDDIDGNRERIRTGIGNGPTSSLPTSVPKGEIAQWSGTAGNVQQWMRMQVGGAVDRHPPPTGLGWRSQPARRMRERRQEGR